MADTATTRGGGRRRLQRGDLTRELIVRESLRLLDTDGIAGFSLPKLGRALGADATAVYRHFASKDDLVLAVADHLIEESAAGVRLGECWVDTLTDSARQLRRTYLAHPAAASLSSYRVTQGPAEMKAVDIIISCVLAAGFEGAEAAVVYRAIGDFGLYWSGRGGVVPGDGRATAEKRPQRLDDRVPDRRPGPVPRHLAGPRAPARRRRRRDLRDEPCR